MSQTPLLTKEQAVLRAVQTLLVVNSVPAVAAIAEEAGMSRGHLYRLASARLKKLETEKAPTEVEAPSTTAEAAAITNESVARTA